jgi:proteasome beta subunit
MVLIPDKRDDMVYKTGTTTVALKCANGVVIGADTRVTAGYYIAHKHGKKIHKITPGIALTIAGVVADAQAIIDIVKYNINLYELRINKKMTAKSAARLLSVILFQNRLFPYVTELIVAGKDSDGYNIYRLDPFGSLISDEIIATGSGSPIAIGVLESEYSKDIAIEEAKLLIAKALNAAMKRDIASGDDIDMAVIDEEGYRELSKDEKNDLLKQLEKREE